MRVGAQGVQDEGGRFDVVPWPPPRRLKVAFLGAPFCSAKVRRLVGRYGESGDAADVVVAVGGNAQVVRALHRQRDRAIPVFGLSATSGDFLTNPYDEDRLAERIIAAEMAQVRALNMVCVDLSGQMHEAVAFNEVALFRQSRRMAVLTLVVDGRARLQRLHADGLLVATPMGSTAYNLSAQGAILPLGSRAIAVTALSPARPRWAGAILPEHRRIRLNIHDPEVRPVAATADTFEARNIVSVEIQLHPTRSGILLFDAGSGLAERQLREQSDR